MYATFLSHANNYCCAYTMISWELRKALPNVVLGSKFRLPRVLAMMKKEQEVSGPSDCEARLEHLWATPADNSEAKERQFRKMDVVDGGWIPQGICASHSSVSIPMTSINYAKW